MEEEDKRVIDEVQFCELITDYYGERIDNINQLAQINFSGDELLEFLNFVIGQDRLLNGKI